MLNAKETIFKKINMENIKIKFHIMFLSVCSRKNFVFLFGA